MVMLRSEQGGRCGSTLPVFASMLEPRLTMSAREEDSHFLSRDLQWPSKRSVTWRRDVRLVPARSISRAHEFQSGDEVFDFSDACRNEQERAWRLRVRNTGRSHRIHSIKTHAC